MSSWAGFTDEELNRLRQQHGAEEGAGRLPQENLKKAGINNVKRQRAREKIRTRVPPLEQKPSSLRSQENQSENRKNIDSSGVGNAGAAVNKATAFRARVDSRDEEGENSSPECERRVKNKQKKETAMVEEAPSTQEHQGGLCKDGPQREQAAEKGIEKKLSDDLLPVVIEENDRIQAIELSALERMQERQKQIEEENKKKKAALQETIKQRYKRTQAEAQTLTLVQKELSHLDNLLSADIAVLRDKIEESSRDYLTAQRRYERAEKEFVESKMDLHKKTEIKDLLTEHLYTIIRENELRKARKLEELTAKLNVSGETLLLQEATSRPVKNNTVIPNQESVDSTSEIEKPNNQTQELTSEGRSSRVDDMTGLVTGSNTAVIAEVRVGADKNVPAQGTETA